MRQTSMPPEGLEPAIPGRERPQTNALGRAAAGIDIELAYYIILIKRAVYYE
jgi:hypothetical protein